MLDTLRGASSLVLAVSLIASLSTTTLAADLPPPVDGAEAGPGAIVPIPPVVPPDGPVPPVVPDGPLWPGFYVGGHLGAAFIDWESETSFVATNPLTGETNSGTFEGPDSSDSTFIGGIHAGYNWQSGNYIFGLDATASALAGETNDRYTISAATLIGEDLAAITDPVDGFVSDWSRSVEWLATIKGRAGYLVNPRAFLYLTGGLAVGEVRSDVSYTGLVDQGVPTLVSVSADSRETEVGYAVGGGAEAALTDRLSIRAEYLFVDLGEADRPLGTYIDSPCCVQTVSVNEDVRIHTVTIGLTYRFGVQ
jgi:outer membrane immunogenic protein